MGWAGATYIVDEVADVALPLIRGERNRKRFMESLYNVFTNEDWDTVSDSRYYKKYFQAIENHYHQNFEE